MRVPRPRQLALALYIILTGDFPMIVQAVALGVEGSAGSEFAAAVTLSLVRDLLLLAPVLVLGKHPLGVLHPLLLAVVVWPLVIGMPKVIEEFGGWAGVMAGVPVETPFYYGLPSRDPSMVWTATAKYNALLIVSLLCTYFGFWVMASKPARARVATVLANTAALRTVLIGLFAISILILLGFLYSRGGIVEHLTALGGGRFRQLKESGIVLVATDLSTVALYLWIAARPGDAKSPLFLLALAITTAGQFSSGGSRGQAFAVPLLVGLIWSLRRRRVPWKLGLLLIPLMFVSLGLLGAVRNASWSEDTASEAFSNTDWATSFRLAQHEVAERRAASSSIPIIQRAGQVTGFLMGATYVTSVTAFVPRSFWLDKPRSAGSLYAQRFLGESKEGAAIPVSPPMEMYWNFGIPGVILLSLLYGLLLKVVYNFMRRRYPDPFAIVFYILFVTNFQFGSRQIVGFEQQVGLLLICYVVVRMIVPTMQATVAPLPSTRRVPSQA